MPGIFIYYLPVCSLQCILMLHWNIYKAMSWMCLNNWLHILLPFEIKITEQKIDKNVYLTSYFPNVFLPS